MKNILLIITLFISWNAIAGEKTWFCATEKRGGLVYKDNAWKATSFVAIRMTVKQRKDDSLLFSSDTYDSAAYNCHLPFPDVRPHIISCSGDMATFSLNTNTGKATSSSGYGWALSQATDTDGKHDTATVSVWTCESF
jgi:hypothetical protein